MYSLQDRLRLDLSVPQILLMPQEGMLLASNPQIRESLDHVQVLQSITQIPLKILICPTF